jgi:hypothetical protein
MPSENHKAYKNNKFKVEIIQDNPNHDSIKTNIVYVVVFKKHKKWAYLRCPCGCNDIIMLTLNPHEFPSWRVKQDKFDNATIAPSIRKLDGCKSHFLIEKGNLIWAHSF